MKDLNFNSIVMAILALMICGGYLYMLIFGIDTDNIINVIMLVLSFYFGGAVARSANSNNK